MKTGVFIFIGVLFQVLGFSQNQAKIEAYSMGGLDVQLMVMPLGVENPIKIGRISKEGLVNFDFPKELSKVSDEVKESESSKLWYTLFSLCNNGVEMVAEADNIFSLDTGSLSLWTTNNKYVGVIFAVSDADLVPWLEDPAYMEPILGSYFKLVYVAKPFQYTGTCISTLMLDEGDAEVSYTYHLNLKAGFNFIEYKIESIHESDPNVMASFPDKVTVLSVEGIPKCKWLGKYF